MRRLFPVPRPAQVRYIGVSNETSYGVSEFCHQATAAGLPKIQSIQNSYSLLVRWAGVWGGVKVKEQIT